MAHVHKKFSTEQIKDLRTSPKRLPEAIENNILKELSIDKAAIENKDVPLKYYNYSYVKDRLEKTYNQKVSLNTIITRAKLNDFYIPRKEHKKVHSREVLTRYIGELIQHDASYHLWAPASKQKWCLITSLQVLVDCRIKPIYALSPQAKGKIERPYQWLQDRIIRSCIRENVTTITHGQRVLNAELDRYNHKQVHSTTGEIPYLRFQNAKERGKSLFRQFTIPLPYLTHKDIFAFRTKHFVDQYCKVTIKNMTFRLKDVEPRQVVVISGFTLWMTRL